MREPLVAWAGDCVVRGDVALGDGRLSDQVNRFEVMTFFGAVVDSLDDGRRVALDELEVERHELHIIEVAGHRGDPARRLRTVPERVRLEVGPFDVTGYVHRAPSAAPLAALSRWARFVPVTDAEFRCAGRDDEPTRREVVLVNRDRISRVAEVAVPSFEPDPRSADAPV